jgi:hypothetical protein
MLTPIRGSSDSLSVTFPVILVCANAVHARSSSNTESLVLRAGVILVRMWKGFDNAKQNFANEIFC